MKKLLNALWIISLGVAPTLGIIPSISHTENHIQAIDLNNIIINKKIGTVYVGQQQVPNKTRLLIAIKATNRTANLLTINDFEFKAGTLKNDSVRIIGKGNYVGELTVRFSTTNFVEMNGIDHKVTSLATSPSGVIYAATENGIYLSSDKVHFIEINKMSDTKSLVISEDGTIFINSHDALWASTNMGKNFTRITNIDSSNCALTTYDNWAYYTSSYGNMTTVYAINASGMGANHGVINDNKEVTSLTVAPDRTIYAATENGIYKNKDNFKFTKVNSLQYHIIDLAIAPDRTIYAAGLGLWKSIDGGITFTSVIDKSSLYTPLTALTITQDGTIYAGSYNWTFKIINDVYSILKGNDIKVTSLVTNSYGTLYAGTEYGVYKSDIN